MMTTSGTLNFSIDENESVFPARIVGHYSFPPFFIAAFFASLSLAAFSVHFLQVFLYPMSVVFFSNSLLHTLQADGPSLSKNSVYSAHEGV
jgi:hypothetical protein